MLLAFLLNLTAFPLFNNLLPVVAKDVYLSDQTTLGYMVAGAASGALTWATSPAICAAPPALILSVVSVGL